MLVGYWRGCRSQSQSWQQVASVCGQQLRKGGCASASGSGALRRDGRWSASIGGRGLSTDVVARGLCLPTLSWTVFKTDESRNLLKKII